MPFKSLFQEKQYPIHTAEKILKNQITRKDKEKKRSYGEKEAKALADKKTEFSMLKEMLKNCELEFAALINRENFDHNKIEDADEWQRIVCDYEMARERLVESYISEDAIKYLESFFAKNLSDSNRPGIKLFFEERSRLLSKKTTTQKHFTEEERSNFVFGCALSLTGIGTIPGIALMADFIYKACKKGPLKRFILSKKINKLDKTIGNVTYKAHESYPEYKNYKQIIKESEDYKLLLQFMKVAKLRFAPHFKECEDAYQNSLNTNLKMCD